LVKTTSYRAEPGNLGFLAQAPGRAPHRLPQLIVRDFNDQFNLPLLKFFALNLQ
jgi:hypothetical protein